MDGLVYTIEKLGRLLAEADQDNARLRQEIAVLRDQLAAKADEQPPS